MQRYGSIEQDMRLKQRLKDGVTGVTEPCLAASRKLVVTANPEWLEASHNSMHQTILDALDTTGPIQCNLDILYSTCRRTAWAQESHHQKKIGLVCH